MNITVNIYDHRQPGTGSVPIAEMIGKLLDITISNSQKLSQIMTNTEKALADIAALKTQLQKIGTESGTLLQKIIDLQNAAPADTPQSVVDGIAEVKAQAQIVDDLVPDAV